MKMVRRATIGLVSLILIVPALEASATSPKELWVERYDRADGADGAHAEALSPDGAKTFVTGYATNATGDYDYATLAYRMSDGSKLWIRRYDGPAGAYDAASALGVSPDGSTLFVTGVSQPTRRDTWDYATIAYDADTGAKRWARRYDGPGSGWQTADSALALAVSPDGTSVFVTGSSGGSVSGDYATIAYDAATGSELWTQRYDQDALDDFATALALSPDGTKVFVTGTGGAAALFGHNFVTIAYDAFSGSQLWRKRSFGGEQRDSEAVDVGVTPDGSKIVVTGYREPEFGGHDDWATIAYDAATGVRLWKRRFGGAAGFNDRAAALAFSPDGSAVFVTGFSADSPGSGDYETLAYDPVTGATVWAARYDGPASGDDKALSVGVSPNGRRVFVTGSGAHETRHDDYATFALRAATGARLWTQHYDGPASGNDGARSIAVSSDGTKVVVTGGSHGSALDYATVAYPVRV